VTDLWSRVQHTPHETFAVLKTEDNLKYVVMISNLGWYVAPHGWHPSASPS
jgi:hypothetical protein